MPNATGQVNAANYHDNGDGTVTDNVTGLMWQQPVPNTAITWTAAVTSCPTLTLGGHHDWRLPTGIELISILDYGQAVAPLIDAVFTSTPIVNYWASNTLAGSPTNAWSVNFANGVTLPNANTTTYYARCVR